MKCVCGLLTCRNGALARIVPWLMLGGWTRHAAYHQLPQEPLYLVFITNTYTHRHTSISHMYRLMHSSRRSACLQSNGNLLPPRIYFYLDNNQYNSIFLSIPTNFYFISIFIKLNTKENIFSMDCAKISLISLSTSQSLSMITASV